MLLSSERSSCKQLPGNGQLAKKGACEARQREIGHSRCSQHQCSWTLGERASFELVLPNLQTRIMLLHVLRYPTGRSTISSTNAPCKGAQEA